MRKLIVLALLVNFASCGKDDKQKVEVKTCLPTGQDQVQEMICTMSTSSPFKICRSENVECRTHMGTGITQCNIEAPVECTSEFRELSEE